MRLITFILLLTLVASCKSRPKSAVLDDSLAAKQLWLQKLLVDMRGGKAVDDDLLFELLLCNGCELLEPALGRGNVSHARPPYPSRTRLHG